MQGSISRNIACAEHSSTSSTDACPNPWRQQLKDLHMHWDLWKDGENSAPSRAPCMVYAKSIMSGAAPSSEFKGSLVRPTVHTTGKSVNSSERSAMVRLRVPFRAYDDVSEFKRNQNQKKKSEGFRTSFFYVGTFQYISTSMILICSRGAIHCMKSPSSSGRFNEYVCMLCITLSRFWVPEKSRRRSSFSFS